MTDFLDTVVRNVIESIKSGYYSTKPAMNEKKSLKRSILSCGRNPIITEVKSSSPSRGVIRKDVRIMDLVSSMQKGGAVGISVLTEPRYFQGSLNSLGMARKVSTVPLLMKDFVISSIQVSAASNTGADAVLLIQALFDRGYCDQNLDETIKSAHSHGLEVLLEAHTEEEFRVAINSHADLFGINNRDLTTLDVDLHVTEEILKKNSHHGRIIVSESGIESPENVRSLRNAGAQAFLVGTAVMSAHNTEEKVRELVEA